MISGRIESDELHRDVDAITRQVDDASPLMRIFTGTLLDQTEENFAREGRPKWLGIQPRPGREGGKILQDTGRLAASITGESGPDYAQVGSNLVYAAIHQLGGKTRRRLQRGLSELLERELAQAGHASFGICSSCRYFRERGRSDDAKGPHLCMLFEDALTPEDTGRICRELQPGA